jgi:hypothetical protein
VVKKVARMTLALERSKTRGVSNRRWTLILVRVKNLLSFGKPTAVPDDRRINGKSNIKAAWSTMSCQVGHHARRAPIHPLRRSYSAGSLLACAATTLLIHLRSILRAHCPECLVGIVTLLDTFQAQGPQRCRNRRF